MKKVSMLLGGILLATSVLTSCGGGMTVCDCIKDDGSHKTECDELAKNLTEAQLLEELGKCE
jgi:hypothetical protein